MIYSNFVLMGDTFLVRGYDDKGKPFKKREKPLVSVFMKDSDIPPSEFTDMFGDELSEITFSSVWEAKKFIKEAEQPLYYNHRFPYELINRMFPGKVEVDISKLKICNIDIECESENGFPIPEEAAEVVNAITFAVNDTYHVFGLTETFDTSAIILTNGEDIKYHSSVTEEELLKNFVTVWQDNYPDIVTGWNCEFFDFPYLANRINNILGEDWLFKLSPWKKVEIQMKKNDFGQEVQSVSISGIAILDYIALYKKFRLKRRDSYRLSNIAEVEGIEQQKMTYDEHKTLKDLYRNDYQKYLRYNMQDVRTVKYLDKKLNYILLSVTLAYQAKVNFDDVLSQVRMWECIIMNELYDMKMIPEIKPRGIKTDKLVGAYVKDAEPGSDHWLVSLDLNSLYPSLIRMLNVSPDTILQSSPKGTVDKDKLNSIIDEFINNRKPIHDGIHIQAFNKSKFRKDKQGIIPYLVTKMYQDRKKYKNLMLKKKKELQDAEKVGDSVLIANLTNEVAKFSTMQESLKVCLNSVYGATGNQYFMFFDARSAEAVTTTGQAAIKWISVRLNEYMNKLLKTADIDYVKYIDTDSVTLKMYPLVKHVYGDNVPEDANVIADFLLKVFDTKILPFIDKMYDEFKQHINADENHLSLKIDTITRKALYLTKKRYIYEVIDAEGIRHDPPEMKIMGLQAIKSSTPAASRVKLKEGIMKIFHGTESECRKFSTEFKKEHDSLPVEDIAAPSGISNITKYEDRTTVYRKGTPAHVKAALVYNKAIDDLGLGSKYRKIMGGDKIKYVLLRMPNPLHQEAIAFVDYMPTEIMEAYNLNKYIDRKELFEKNFLSPYNDMVEGAGFKTGTRGSLAILFAKRETK